MLAQFATPVFLEMEPFEGVADMESRINQLGIAVRRSTTAYVLRMQRSQATALRDPDSRTAIDELLRKAADIPVYALSWQKRYRLERILVDGTSRIGARAALEALRQADLFQLVDDARNLCFLQATPSYHFVAPSGQHCSAFFRLGDAIASKRSLDRLAFWMLSSFHAADAVILDNWSIASLALRTMALAKRDIPFDCVASHPQNNPAEAERIILQLIQNARTPGLRLLFVVSVTSSGTYAQIVRRIAQKLLAPEQISLLALYGLANTPGDVPRLCMLELSPQNVAAEHCVPCKTKSSSAIALDPGLFYLKARTDHPVALRKAHFVDRSFVDRYGKLSGLFRVHRDDAFKRHHAFHLDVSVLIERSKSFRQRLDQELAKHAERVDLLISPPVAMSCVADRAGQVLRVPRIAGESLRVLENEDKQRLASARHILIVDDVLDSGALIEEYISVVREVCEPAAVHVLIGVARTPSEEALAEHRTAWTKNVQWDATVVPIETFFLPDWAEEQCPWCAEFSFLSAVAQAMASPPPWLAKRILKLSEPNAAEALDPIFLFPGTRKRTLGHGSVVANARSSAAATLFSVANAMQQLRHDKKPTRRLNPLFPNHQVMAARNLKNYSETFLRALLLRAVGPGEWGTTQRQLAGQLLARGVRRPSEARFLAGEMLLAVMRETLDRSVINALTSLGSVSAWIELLIRPPDQQPTHQG